MVFQLSGKAESERGRRAEAVQGEEQSSLERDTGCGQVGGGGCSRQGRKQQTVWGAAKAFLPATDISQTKRRLQHHGSSLCRQGSRTDEPRPQGCSSSSTVPGDSSFLIQCSFLNPHTSQFHCARTGHMSAHPCTANTAHGMTSTALQLSMSNRRHPSTDLHQQDSSSHPWEIT